MEGPRSVTNSQNSDVLSGTSLETREEKKQ